MPAYRWTCLACGSTNAPRSSACDACGCPARARTADIERCRDRFVASGGRLQGAAAEAVVADLSAFDVLVRPTLPVLALLFGGWWW